MVPLLELKPTLEWFHRNPRQIPPSTRTRVGETRCSADPEVDRIILSGYDVAFMPRFLEEDIRRLCERAIHAENPEDAERLAGELRSAMQEYMRLAKQSLVDRSRTISLLDPEYDSKPRAGQPTKKSA